MLAERYHVLAAIGKGGMGSVYRVEHVALKKEMALKLLPEGMHDSADLVRRFEREAEAAARLDHPNIIRVTDFGRSEEGQFFLAMELLEGTLLADALQPGGEGTRVVAMAPDRAAHIAAQIARALDHAHAVGVIHRDLKPANIILVARDGERDIVKLLDFGIAKLLQPEGGGEALTQAGMVYGTPEYLSPEQAVGDPIDLRADLYSLGVILFEMLAGRLPFQSVSKLEILHKHVHERPPSLADVAPQTPDDLVELVERLLDKQRQARPASARLVAEELAQADMSSASLASLPKNGVLRAGRQTITSLSRFARRTSRRLRHGTTRERLRASVPLAILLTGLLGFVWVSRAGGSRVETRSTEPQQVALVEALLGSGQLAAARAALQQIVAEHPTSARAHFLYGHLNYVEGERLRALADYRKALELAPALADEPAMRANIRASLDRKAEAPLAIDLLAQTLGPKGQEDLATCARSCRIDSVKRRAAEALEKREAPDAPGLGAGSAAAKDDAPAVDPLAGEVETLRRGKTCALRKSAALAIIASRDKKYYAVLKAARDRRGGFLGLEKVNGCMTPELDEALITLGAK